MPQTIKRQLAIAATALFLVFLSIGILAFQTVSAAPKWLTPSDPNVVSYTDAIKYLDQSKVVEGTIVYTYVSKSSTVYLDFHDPYKGYFNAVIFSSNTKNFNFSPATFYMNKEVRISGTIKLYQGDPQIIVNTPAQIEVANMGFNYP
ncbi:MAG: OB-fold nucleic acid binding domain-containing protein [Candidatus Bathyarchaeia archaeon]|jgi:DNA/RNA endonuclease YhcR with UshA esterase domain